MYDFVSFPQFVMEAFELPIISGQIVGCTECSDICHYRCCDQSKAGDPDFSHENSILLYPGEWESVAEETRKHLLITMGNFNGGKLAYCDRDNFDQSKCHPLNNFKPLDCETYPFAPVIRDGKLNLIIDSSRCPLPVSQLENHAIYILKRWQEAIDQNPDVTQWISALDLPHYIPYHFSASQE